MKTNLQEVVHYVEDKHGKDWERLPDSHPDIMLMQMIANKGKVLPKKYKRIATEEEKNYIRLHHENKTNKELAAHLKMSVEKLAETMNNMGIKKFRGGKKVERLSENGRVSASYRSISEAALATGVSHTGIVNACKGRIKTSGGYRWRYEGEEK